MPSARRDAQPSPSAPTMRPTTAMLLIAPSILVFSALSLGGQSLSDVVPNPSFEEGGEERPARWQPARWNGEGMFELVSPGHTGARCASIYSESGADASWATTVPVEILARYRLSGWIRTENVATTEGGRGALLNIHNLQPTQTAALTGTTDWTRVEVEFETGFTDSIQINCLFGGWGLATGTAYFDDLRLELLSRQDFAPGLTIDARVVGEPISKYIYGQFIEHLGRCIYGGIWAEMIEDRKFFDAVGAEGSPWRGLSAGDAVVMEGEGSFVGEHTPAIALPGGIAQAGLGLVAGKEYEGRLWLAGSGAPGAVEVSLVWGDGEGERGTVTLRTTGEEYRRSSLRFTAGASTDDGRLEIRGTGEGTLRVGTVSLMPADHVHGMRRDTLALLRELNSPVYRWPGGNFVSGYDWRDGIGDPDRRPPRKNPAWTGIEHNDFGLDEFLVFCRELGTEPYIALNSGLGGVESAVDELRYANAPASTDLGAQRAANGHPEPYGVHFWGIGNEMYGGWQLGHMPLAEYTQKHNRFAEALRAADPSIELVGVGAVGPWSEGMMQQCAAHMDLVSEHFYRGEQSGLASHVWQVPEAVRTIAEAHRRYRDEFASLAGKDIRIALDEWNYWYGPHPYGELGTRYFLKDALGIAAGLNEFARHSDLYFMANYAQTVNVIGAIKTTKTAAAFATTGLVLQLYRERFGVLPVQVTCAPPLDAMAAFTADNRHLTLAVVNPTTRPVDLPLHIEGVTLAGTGTRWQIAGDDPLAHNTPGEAPQVTIEQSPVTDLLDTLSLPPCSVTLFALDLR